MKNSLGVKQAKTIDTEQGMCRIYHCLWKLWKICFHPQIPKMKFICSFVIRETTNLRLILNCFNTFSSSDIAKNLPGAVTCCKGEHMTFVSFVKYKSMLIPYFNYNHLFVLLTVDSTVVFMLILIPCRKRNIVVFLRANLLSGRKWRNTKFNLVNTGNHKEN